jgi:hypothetical protein
MLHCMKFIGISVRKAAQRPIFRPTGGRFSRFCLDLAPHEQYNPPTSQQAVSLS